MRCFSSPRLLPVSRDDRLPCRVAPFGNLRVTGYLLLAAAYHVLLRLREPRHPPYALLYFLRRAREIFSDLTRGIVYTGVILVRFFYSIYFRFNMSMISFAWRITDSNR